MTHSQFLKKQADSQMLLICGFPSGGTDLTKTILNAHPDVYINGEMPFLREVKRWGYDWSSQFQEIAEIELLRERLRISDHYHNIENIEHKFINELATVEVLSLDDILYTLFSSERRKIWGNKTPQNTEYIDLLLSIFPRAKVLMVTRDVRDVCLSWHNKWGKDMLLCAHKWNSRMQKGYDAAMNLPSEQVHIIQFEKLLNETETICRQICTFLGIPFATTMLAHHKYVNSSVDGKINYGKAIKVNNQQKWKAQLSATTARRIEEIAWDTMNLLNYKPIYAKSEQSIKRSERSWGKVKDTWSLFFVGNRASTNNNLRQRLRTIFFEIRKRQLFFQ
jgi:hypothetical protein